LIVIEIGIFEKEREEEEEREEGIEIVIEKDTAGNQIKYDDVERAALYVLLSNSFKKNNLQYAETIVDKLTASDPEDNFAQYFSAKIKIENKKYTEAYAILQNLKMRKYWPDSVKTQLISVVSFDELENMIKDTNSLSALQLAKVGERFVLEKRDSDAQMFFTRALKMDSNSVEALYQAARWNMNKNDYKTAERLLNRLLTLDSTSSRTLGRYAMMLHETGRAKLALAYYKNAIERNEYDFNLAYNLGELYLSDLKDDENAKKYFLKAIDIEPNVWQSYFKLGLIYMENNFYDTAINYLTKADGYSAENPRILYLLATAYEKNKDYENALNVYDRLFKINPLDNLVNYKRRLLKSK
jgi:tetratricopeptide (TPR) repeat protein